MLRLKTLEDVRAFLRDNTMAVINGSATWCGPCPKALALALEHRPSVAFATFDVDEADDVAMALGVQAMPTFLFFLNASEVDRVEGADIRAVEAAVARLRKYAV